MKEINELFEKAIEDRVFPSASLLVFERGTILFKGYYGTYSYESERKIDEKSLYDIASLTKPLVTSLSFAFLLQENELTFENEMGFYFREFKKVDKLGITIRDMLAHRSGLPSHREYFKKIEENRWGSIIARDEIHKMALVENIGERGKTLYSDIDFIILGYLIEVITTKSLRDFFVENILKRLSISESDFCGNNNFAKRDRMIPVSDEFVGVDDENSRAMGGIAGHSGLFSNVSDIHKILLEIYESYNNLDWRLFRPDVIKELLVRSNDFVPSMFRGGFDTPLVNGSQYGDYFTGDVIAHLGFTGTSFVMDISDGFGVILLTNRVCPDRTNTKIKEFRRVIHNRLYNLFKEG